MWPNLQFPADLVTFTEKILNKKLHFFVRCGKLYLVKISSWSSEKPFEKHFPRNNNLSARCLRKLCEEKSDINWIKLQQFFVNETIALPNFSLEHSLIHFRPIFPFYNPWKHQKNLFSDFFWGYKMGLLTRNGLIFFKTAFLINLPWSIPII